MRIVMVHAPNEWGGAERYTRDVAVGLSARGHDVVVVVKPGSVLHRSLASTSVRVEPLELGLSVGWHTAIGPLNHPLNWVDLYANPLRARLNALLDALAREQSIDVLHAQHIKEKLWVTSYGYREGVPVAWTAHAPLEPWMRESAPGRVHRRCGDWLTGLIAVAQATLADYGDFGILPPIAEVIYNGLDSDEYSSGERMLTRQALELCEDQIVVLVPARPYQGKGIGVVLDALELLSSAEPAIARKLRVLVAGGSRHVPAFSADAERRGLGGMVSFLGHRDDMPNLLAASDIVALPSFYEGLPYAISEAMAAGKPVIATRVGGIPEMVEYGGSGLLIEPRDARALMASIVRLAGDAGVRGSFGARGQSIAVQKFSLDTMLDETVDVFERVSRR